VENSLYTFFSVFIRKVTTKSGATAIQVAHRVAKRDVVIKHLGSAHSQQELTTLVQKAQQFISKDQPSLFDNPIPFADIVALGSSAIFLFQTLQSVYRSLHFDRLQDFTFEHLVLARLIEPASKLDTIRILDELGVDHLPSYTSIHRCLKKVVDKNYRAQLSALCLHASRQEHLSLLLYDVTTLYFEIQKEDEFRKPGLSKERRLEPQIVVGLLVDRLGFPLELHEFEGSMAETKTLIPVINQFCQTHHIDTGKITITADAGMLSANNLAELELFGFSFIVGSRIAKTPYQIKEYAKSHPDEELVDGQILETTQAFGYRKENKVERRVIYQYRKKRAQLDLSNIDKQICKAKRIISGQAPLKKAAFITLTKTRPALNQELIVEHRLRAGIKGYVTNIPSPQDNPTSGVPPQELIAAYHQLFQVEKSFRMSKSDLKARPIFHRKLDSIRAHLTIVFAALAIARYIETRTTISIRKFAHILKRVQTPTVRMNGEIRKIPPEISGDVENLVQKLK